MADSTAVSTATAMATTDTAPGPFTEEAYRSALLSEAIYTNKLPVWHEGDDPARYKAALTQALTDRSKSNGNVGNKISQAQAEEVAGNFRLIRSTESDPFTAGVFVDTAGKSYLAIRGTANASNDLEDLVIGLRGVSGETVDRLAQFWNDDCKDLHHSKLVVGGHSLGGAAASYFARMFPENTDKVVTLNSAGVSDRPLVGMSQGDWQKHTTQAQDLTYGAAKTTAFSVDTLSGVHLSIGPLYYQIGTQVKIPFAEYQSHSPLQEHSSSNVLDGLKFETVNQKLGNMPVRPEIASAALKAMGPHAFHIQMGSESHGNAAGTAAPSRNQYYLDAKYLEDHAADLQGKVSLLNNSYGIDDSGIGRGFSHMVAAIREEYLAAHPDATIADKYRAASIEPAQPGSAGKVLSSSLDAAISPGSAQFVQASVTTPATATAEISH